MDLLNNNSSSALLLYFVVIKIKLLSNNEGAYLFHWGKMFVFHNVKTTNIWIIDLLRPNVILYFINF